MVIHAETSRLRSLKIIPRKTTKLYVHEIGFGWKDIGNLGINRYIYITLLSWRQGERVKGVRGEGEGWPRITSRSWWGRWQGPCFYSLFLS
jgi:hypothetical protein